MKVLIIEDDVKTASAICRGLERDGYEPIMTHTGEQGLRCFEAASFDLIVLDWMLPDRNGIQILTHLRGRGTRIPVLLLTARDSVEDRVFGLDAGADDYLIKPFAFSELLARLRVLLRRAGEHEPLRLQIGDLFLDLEKRQVLRGLRKIPLSPREFDLLACLARHQGQTVSRHMLARDVWKELQRATPLDNVIDVHVAHLRRKIDDGQGVKLLHTVRGVGFVLKESPSRE
jgi:two-component system copper resistance phosphate regulon response regulator CusR